MILKVGLTGGIASGKSTIAKILASLGCHVIDADLVVRDLYRPGRAGHSALVQRYGREILTDSGEIDRVKLSALGLGTPEAAEELNRLIHPLVIQREQEWIEQIESEEETDAIVVVEATLLLESGGRNRYDRIVVIDVDPEIQLARAVKRGLTPEEARRRIARQMTRAERLHHADYVIRNHGDLVEAEQQARDIVERLREDLEAKKRGEPLARQER